MLIPMSAAVKQDLGLDALGFVYDRSILRYLYAGGQRAQGPEKNN